MSDERKDELWGRWHSGESISEISRAMGKLPGSVYTILRLNGGVWQRPRRRRDGHLTLAEREEVSRGLSQGLSVRGIAERLGVEADMGVPWVRGLEVDDPPGAVIELRGGINRAAEPDRRAASRQHDVSRQQRSVLAVEDSRRETSVKDIRSAPIEERPLVSIEPSEDGWHGRRIPAHTEDDLVVEAPHALMQQEGQIRRCQDKYRAVDGGLGGQLDHAVDIGTGPLLSEPVFG